MADSEAVLQPIVTRELAEQLINAASSGSGGSIELRRLEAWGRELRIVHYQYRIMSGGKRAQLTMLDAGGSSTTPATDIAALCRTPREVLLLALGGYANQVQITIAAGDVQNFERIGEQWYVELKQGTKGA